MTTNTLPSSEAPMLPLEQVTLIASELGCRGISGIGASSALTTMMHYWTGHLQEGHSPQILLDDIQELILQLTQAHQNLSQRLGNSDVCTQDVPGSPDAAPPSERNPVRVSLDGGVTYSPAPQGVRLIYPKVFVPGEDEPGELHINCTQEGLVTDVWVSREEHLDHNIGTGAELLEDIVSNLVADNN